MSATRFDYREHYWHYLVKEWRGDRLAISLSTDNHEYAVNTAIESKRPTLVLDAWLDEIIYRNY